MPPAPFRLIFLTPKIRPQYLNQITSAVFHNKILLVHITSIFILVLLSKLHFIKPQTTDEYPLQNPIPTLSLSSGQFQGPEILSEKPNASCTSLSTTKVRSSSYSETSRMQTLDQKADMSKCRDPLQVLFSSSSPTSEALLWVSSEVSRASLKKRVLKSVVFLRSPGNPTQDVGKFVTQTSRNTFANQRTLRNTLQ